MYVLERLKQKKSKDEGNIHVTFPSVDLILICKCEKVHIQLGIQLVHMI